MPLNQQQQLVPNRANSSKLDQPAPNSKTKSNFIVYQPLTKNRNLPAQLDMYATLPGQFMNRVNSVSYL